ncbi:catalase [Sporosarcina aquimarina]|uniref:Catalase n=1 Tax=Sporosarcina aquimarina TaxID=114975 RepID=A0ABU4G123_9BACL|nr:catalase [Sporosarcina aquimarina]MDW0110643.1 catalase [Sporosarcina aquimarina]
MNSSQEKNSITPVEAIDAIEEVAGTYPGFRRAHAKGIGFDALFTSNGNAAPFTEAKFLQAGQVNAVVRFSHASPVPDFSERLMPIKGMAVQFQVDDNKPVSFAMANVPIFPTKTPEAFIRLIKVLGGSEKSFNEKLKIISNDTEFKTVPSLLKQLKTPSSFASTSFWAIHAYILTTALGEQQAVRFSFVPVTNASKLPFSTKDMEQELLERMSTSQVAFRLMMTVASPEDPTDDPSVSWPDERLVIDVGNLVLLKKREDNAENHFFDPTHEVSGFSCSDDPVLQYRSPLYEESYRRRSNHM